MRHLDLFSGIGGFALATEMVWDNVEHIFCDNDAFSQAILNKHWPHSKIYGDIRTLTANAENAEQQLAMERKSLKKNSLIGGAHPQTIDLLTGGFPCQPFSHAGRRRGTEDGRFLWPEMSRVIREFLPRWIIAENVSGLVTLNGGMVLGQVRSDLENAGYETQSFIIPAVGLNAPHRRDRIWIIAHSDRGEHRRGRGSDEKAHGIQEINREKICIGRTGRANKNASDTNGAGIRKQSKSEQGGKGKTIAVGSIANSEYGTTRNTQRRRNEKRTSTRASGSDPWKQHWLEVATRLCRMDDGISRRMDRAPRLKALGNAIVPQVAAEIMRAIKHADEISTAR